MSVRLIVWSGLLAVAQMVSCRETRKFKTEKQNAMGGLGQTRARCNFESDRNLGISGQACRKISGSSSS